MGLNLFWKSATGLNLLGLELLDGKTHMSIPIIWVFCIKLTKLIYSTLFNAPTHEPKIRTVNYLIRTFYIFGIFEIGKLFFQNSYFSSLAFNCST